MVADPVARRPPSADLALGFATDPDRSTAAMMGSTRIAPACGAQVAGMKPATRAPWSPRKREASPLTAPSDAFTCLRAVDLFVDLAPAEIAAMDLMIPATHYRAGELVFSQSEPVTALFILKRGRVRVFRVTEDGKALTMAILEPGAVFGEMLQLGQRMYDNYAEAIEDCTICRLSAGDVERQLLADPRVAVRITRLLGEEIARLEDRLTDLALRPLSARAAGTLVRLADSGREARFGAAPVIRLTHEQLAGLLAATREATSKTLAEFGARHLIRQARGRITVLDRPAAAPHLPRLGATSARCPVRFRPAGRGRDGRRAPCPRSG